LFALGWSPAPQSAGPPAALLDVTELTKDEDGPAAAHRIASHVLEQLQSFLASEYLSGSRLAIVTKEAVAVAEGEEVSGLASSALWDLIRSAQSEHPERLLLIDVDDTEASLASLPSALASEEPQLAIRAGALLVPRLKRASSPTEPETKPF